MAKATFAAGCFWGIEAAFRRVEGVTDARVGYAGGSTRNPTYEQVCGGATGHAEVVEVDFDSGVVSYDELLEVFWQVHDPTQLNRQGPDVGTQYRSAIYHHDADQAQAAAASKRRRGRHPAATRHPSSPSWRRRPSSGWPRTTTSATSRSGAPSAAPSAASARRADDDVRPPPLARRRQPHHVLCGGLAARQR